MKQKLSTFIQPLMVIAALAIIVSVASAWTGPSGTFPAGNVNAPLNTGGIDQSKIGNLGTLKSFIAGDSIGAGSLMLGNKGAFGCNGTPCWNANYAAANTDKLRAGVFDSAGAFLKGLVINQAGKSLIGTGNTTTGNFNGVVVDPTGDFSVGKRTNWLTNGLYVSGQTGGVAITGPLAIPTGNPGAGKVLTSDATGNASWGGGAVNLSGNGGLIKYVRSQGSGQTTAFCGGPSGDVSSDDVNWVAIGGGGKCNYGIKTSESVISRSGSTGGTTTTPAIGWNVQCLEKANDPVGSAGNIIVSGGGSNSSAWAEVVCMKRIPLMTGVVATSSGTSNTGGGSGGGTITPSGTTWHDVTKATGTAGQTCAQWLAGYPNFSGSNTNVRVSGVLGGIPLSLDQGCAYTRTVSGTTYCASGDFNIGKSLVIGGVSTGLAPTATCSGVDLNSSGQQVVSNWKTQIQY